ncbi:hypothetical protein [Shewanella surugensis]|uniref:Uncharacterized protein n=1 Tax=Shewanella surugensis TaxID=212020 RepID=A0ABT0L629_9GAMM|nr:hypothetical protein [Shewanella surugensis]MCL1123139.1 hypothetical protein [Shewanella surugensis]
MSTPIQPSSVYNNTVSYDSPSDEKTGTVKSGSQSDDELRLLKDGAESGKPDSLFKLYQLSTEPGEQAEQAKMILANLQPDPLNLTSSSNVLLQSSLALYLACKENSTAESKAALQALNNTLGSEAHLQDSLNELILTSTHKTIRSETSSLQTDNNQFQMQSQAFREKFMKNE